MKSAKFILLGLLLATYVLSYGQVGVDNTDPDPSSVMDLNATDKGLLIPRMTSTQRLAIGSPANSLLVFDTSLNLYFYYINDQWNPLSPWISSGTDIYYNAGNVGIGTSSPLTQFHVLNNTHNNLLVDRTDTQDFMALINGSGGSGLKFTDSNFFFIASDSYANRNSGSVGNELFRINSNGNIGIGTNTPLTKLHIADGNGGEQLRFSRGTGSVRFAQDLNQDNLYLFNNNGSQTYMFWGANGNVGVGKSSPAYKLDVNGSVNATALYVNGSPVSAGSAIPAGAIIMWTGSTAPAGWALCNGQNGTPDLRDRFIVGAGSSYGVGNTGGLNQVTLTTPQIPSHTHSMPSGGNHTHTTSLDGAHSHTYQAPITSGSHPGGSGGYNRPNGLETGTTSFSSNHSHTISSSGTHTHTINNEGGGQAHENRPPYYALAFIMKL